MIKIGDRVYIREITEDELNAISETDFYYINSENKYGIILEYSDLEESGSINQYRIQVEDVENISLSFWYPAFLVTDLRKEKFKRILK